MEGDPDLKAWPVFAILVIQVILFLAHWFVYSTCIAFWPGLAPAAVADLRVAMLVLAFSFVVASLLSFRFPTLPSGCSTGSRLSGSAFSTFFSGRRASLWLAWFALRLSHLAANPAGVRPPLAAAIYAMAALAAPLRPHQRPHHSHPPHSGASSQPARVLAWPQGRSAQRSAPGPHQRRPILPPPGCTGRKLPSRHRLSSRRPLRRHKGRSRSPARALQRAFPALRHLLLHRQSRGVYDPAHYIEAVTRAGIRVLANEQS